MNRHPKALIVKDLTKIFSQGSESVKVLEAVTYRFEQGKTYAITGSSGTGKSTLLHLLAGMESPTGGTVYLEESDGDLLSSSMGFVFQIPHLIDELTLLENVMIQGLIKGQSESSLTARALLLLRKVGLAHKSSYKPRSLSGGEQQRVSVARALFNEPFFIIADEPTAHLDEQTGKELIELLLRSGCGLIVASHDTSLTKRMEVNMELVQGRLVELPLLVSRVQYSKEFHE